MKFTIIILFAGLLMTFVTACSEKQDEPSPDYNTPPVNSGTTINNPSNPTTPTEPDQSTIDSEHYQMLTKYDYWEYQHVLYDSKHRKSSEERIRFTFMSKLLTLSYTQVSYSYNGVVGSISTSSLAATGTYSIKGNKLECYFFRVSVDNGTN